MPDLAKCTDVKCPSREQCWRWVAPSDRWQSYADFDRPEDAERCADGWWPLDDFRAGTLDGNKQPS